MRELQELAKLIPKAFSQAGDDAERRRIGWEYVHLERSWPQWPKDLPAKGKRKEQLAIFRKEEIRTVCKAMWLAMTDSERRQAAVMAKDWLHNAKVKNFAPGYLDTWLTKHFGKAIQARLPFWMRGT